jgi:hypothetical protein
MIVYIRMLMLFPRLFEIEKKSILLKRMPLSRRQAFAHAPCRSQSGLDEKSTHGMIQVSSSLSLLRFLPPCIFRVSGSIVGIQRVIMRGFGQTSIHGYLFGRGFGREWLGIVNFIILLGRHAAHGNDLYRPNTTPTRHGTRSTRPTSTSGFPTTLLGSATAGGTKTDQTGGAAHANATHHETMRQLRKEADTGIDAIFRRIGH